MLPKMDIWSVAPHGIVLALVVAGGYAQYSSFKTHVEDGELAAERRFVTIEREIERQRDVAADVRLTQVSVTTTLEHVEDRVESIDRKIDRLLDELRSR